MTTGRIDPEAKRFWEANHPGQSYEAALAEGQAETHKADAIIISNAKAQFDTSRPSSHRGTIAGVLVGFVAFFVLLALLAPTPTIRIAAARRTPDGIRVQVASTGIPSGTRVDVLGSLAEYGYYGQFDMSSSCRVGWSGSCSAWLPATYNSWGDGPANSRVPNGLPEMVYAQAWSISYGLPPLSGGVVNPSAQRLMQPIKS